jgi:hypothetical protein
MVLDFQVQVWKGYSYYTIQTWIIHKSNHGSKYPSGTTQAIGCTTNGLRYTHSSWKISIPNGVCPYRQFPARFAVKLIIKPPTIPMQRRWDFEIRHDNERSGHQVGAFFFKP